MEVVRWSCNRGQNFCKHLYSPPCLFDPIAIPSYSPDLISMHLNTLLVWVMQGTELVEYEITVVWESDSLANEYFISPDGIMAMSKNLQGWSRGISFVIYEVEGYTYHRIQLPSRLGRRSAGWNAGVVTETTPDP